MLTAFLCGFSQPPSSPPGPVSFSRDADTGRFAPDAPLPDAQAAIWDEKNPAIDDSNIIRTWTFMHGGISTRMRLKTVAVFLENEEDLLKHTALVFIKELDANRLDTVRLYYPGQTLPEGAVKPDMFIRLRSESTGTTNSLYMIGGSAYLDSMQPKMQSTAFLKRTWYMDADITLEPLFSRQLSEEELGWKFGSDLAQLINENIDKWTEEYGGLPRISCIVCSRLEARAGTELSE